MGARANGCPWTAYTQDRAAEELGYTDDFGHLVLCARTYMYLSRGMILPVLDEPNCRPWPPPSPAAFPNNTFGPLRPGLGSGSNQSPMHGGQDLSRPGQAEPPPWPPRKPGVGNFVKPDRARGHGC